MMNLVRKCVSAFDWTLEIVVQVMNVHVPIAETPPGCDMEIANNFVYPQASFYTTALFSLGVETLAVMFPFALLNVFSAAKRP